MLFSPVGFKGNRFHYWTLYIYVFFPGGVNISKWKLEVTRAGHLVEGILPIMGAMATGHITVIG